MLEQRRVKDGKLKTDLKQEKVLASACHEDAEMFARDGEEHTTVTEM